MNVSGRFWARVSRRVALGVVFSTGVFVLGVEAGAQGKSAELDAVLKQMDASSARFKSAEANLKRDIYERVVKDTTTQTGITYYQRAGTGVQVGIKFDPPSSQIVEIKDGAVRLFEPKTNHLTQISLKKNQAQYESFLAIGFGGSGADLAKQWTINYQGTEQVNDGKKMVLVAKLDLVAKDPETLKLFSHVTIWVDPAQDVSLKQQLFLNDGNIQTATYSNLRVNQLSKSAIDGFAIKTDKKTTVDNH